MKYGLSAVVALRDANTNGPPPPVGAPGIVIDPELDVVDPTFCPRITHQNGVPVAIPFPLFNVVFPTCNF